MKDMKVGSPSNGPFLTLVHQGPKIEFSQRKIDTYTMRKFSTIFFSVFSVPQKKETNAKIEKYGK